MSYILEALRRAERERAVGQTPPLQIVTQGGAPQIVEQGRRPPWIVIGAAAVAFALVLFALLRPSAPEPSAQPEPVTEEPAAEPAPPPPLVVAQAASPAIDAGEDVATLDDLGAQRRGGTQQASVSEPPPPIEPFDAAQEPAPQSVALRKPEPPADEVMVDELELADDLEEPAPVAAPPPTPAPVVETVRLDPPPKPAPLRLKDMPADYRADFPRFTIDVHVYDKKPVNRWAIINARRYREGEVMPEGPRLIEIVREGIVLEYRGKQVVYPLPR